MPRMQTFSQMVLAGDDKSRLPEKGRKLMRSASMLPTYSAPPTGVVIDFRHDAGVPGKRRALVKTSSVRQQAEMYGNLSLTRRFVSTFSGCQLDPGQPYAVVYIFAGRRDRMRVLMRYLDSMLVTGALNEVHVWDRTRDDDDTHWVHSLGNKSYQIHEEADGNRPMFGGIYRYYSTQGEFVPRCGNVARNDTVLVKADDDIVFVNTSYFQEFVRYVYTHPSMFIVHANIVNNGVTAYYQSLHVKGLLAQVPAAQEYPSEGFSGELCVNGSQALELHRFFLAHRSLFSWKDPANDSCIVFQAPEIMPGRGGQGRFSLNFFGARQSSYSEMSTLVNRYNDDEHALTTKATEQGHKECIYTPFNVAHLSYFSQRPHADHALPGYESLSKSLAVP